MRWLELAIALGVILAGAELFTNGVEWVGEGFGLPFSIMSGCPHR